MPKVSRDSAPQRQEDGPAVDLRDELDGYTVSFTSVLEDIDGRAAHGRGGHDEEHAGDAGRFNALGEDPRGGIGSA
jgi:hypothetical protein